MILFLLSIKYSLIIDAGSTATRIASYYWDETIESSEVKVFENPNNSKPKSINIPLSNAIHDVNAIPRIFSAMLDWAKAQIPPDAYKDTTIDVYGTSSMRQLTASEQRTIMKSVRAYLQDDGTFSMDDFACRVLSTTEESSFLWVALNTLLGTIDTQPRKIASLEIASQNAAFGVNIDSTKNIKQWVSSIIFPTESFEIFVPVYEGLGVDEIILNHTVSLASAAGKSQISSPCFLKGYTGNILHFTVTGEGNYEKCYEDLSENPLIKSKCPATDCMFNGVPRVPYDILYGLSTLYYTRTFFGLDERAKVSEYVAKGKEYCSKDFSTVQSQYPDNEYISRYCIYVAFMTNFLQRGLGVTDATDLRVTDSINGQPISYTLGIVLAQQKKMEYAQNPLKWYELLVVILFFAIFVGIIIVIIVCCCLSNKKKKAKENEILLLQYQWEESDSSYQRAKEDGEDDIEAAVQKTPDQKIADNMNKAVAGFGKAKLEIKTKENEIAPAMQEMAQAIAPSNVLNGNIQQVRSESDKVQTNMKDGFTKMGDVQLTKPELADEKASNVMKDLGDNFNNIQLEKPYDNPNSMPNVMKAAADGFNHDLKTPDQLGDL
ncbi:hypothetical protein TRFO_12123 [Tritrichomonas foetus]|uniref:GDA1/CD39 family protein n=1 Tax=Tritrichomonas foetus TaxID=1144522 RepID=A0A1J4J0L7_9EUKA|nr:hypothetical protein TRFO_12123 [Tritrichomonas foetus]|eukprot:OHS92946.1 hypothetical protein TRFO_12123 [Tritrichomonas foetus]